jgi:UTP:GlnB (protein PII) uridylyltransferase
VTAVLLSIEAQDHPGLLSEITAALFRVGVRVLWSDVLTVGFIAGDPMKPATNMFDG